MQGSPFTMTRWHGIRKGKSKEEVKDNDNDNNKNIHIGNS